jgi:hypothetical protein
LHKEEKCIGMMKKAAGYLSGISIASCSAEVHFYSSFLEATELVR